MPDPLLSPPSTTKANRSFFQIVKSYGESPYPPGVTALLIAAPNPTRPLPLLFSGVLAFSSYLSATGHRVDGAGVSAAWSTLYIVAASRRKHTFAEKLGRAGAIRSLTMGACLLNMLGGGVAYTFGSRSVEERDR